MGADEKRKRTDSDRRKFLRQAAAGVIGVAAAAPAFAQSTRTGAPQGETREQLRQDMMGSIEDKIKKDLDLRASSSTEELPEPKNLRPRAMLDARFPVYYRTSVPESMRLLTEYFAAFSERDMNTVARTLHFPYATYEGTEPLVYRTAQEFINNPPPSIHESTASDSQFRPGFYDILDELQVHTYNPVNVGLELSYTRYRADGYRTGINQGIYAVTNNEGKWGIQLSSVIFTPTEYIGVKYNDAEEAMLRQGRTSMAEFADRDYDLLTNPGGAPGGDRRRIKTASIAGAPGALTFLLSGWAGKPMEPYNSKVRKSRLNVSGFPNDAEINAIAVEHDAIADYERGLGRANVITSDGKPGFIFTMAGGSVGHYGYALNLAESRVLHAGPEKAHSLGGYIRYTPDNALVSETRSLAVTVYDKRQREWLNSGAFGQCVRRDRSNDDL